MERQTAMLAGRRPYPISLHRQPPWCRREVSLQLVKVHVGAGNPEFVSALVSATWLLPVKLSKVLLAITLRDHCSAPRQLCRRCPTPKAAFDADEHRSLRQDAALAQCITK